LLTLSLGFLSGSAYSIMNVAPKLWFSVIKFIFVRLVRGSSVPRTLSSTTDDDVFEHLDLATTRKPVR
jgi:hypothetical protein